MEGYFDDPAATAEAFEGGFLRTGDLGYLDGGELFVTGRKKEIIIKGGHNLLPSVIEEIASSVEDVRSGCVVAVGVRSPEDETELVYVVAETKLDRAEHEGLGERVRRALHRAGDRRRSPGLRAARRFAEDDERQAAAARGRGGDRRRKGPSTRFEAMLHFKARRRTP